MAILSVDTSQTGQVGVLPSYASINTSDTEATVLTTGYLNKEVANGTTFSLPCIAKVTTQSSPSSAPVVGWYNVAHVPPNWSLTATTSPGGVRLPVVAGHFAQFVDTLGTIGDDNLSPTSVALTKVTMFDTDQTSEVNFIPSFVDSHGSLYQAVDGTSLQIPGNLLLGRNTGLPGVLLLYPDLASTGTFQVSPTANGSGNFTSTITNGSIGQSSVYHLTDPGVSDTNFIVSDGASVDAGTCQAIRTGSFQLYNGNLYVGQNTSAGSGFLQVFPTTPFNGSIVVQAVDNALNFAAFIHNKSGLGQHTHYTLPDPIDPACSFAVCTTNFTAGYVVIGTGVEGLLDARASTDFELSANIQAALSSDVGGAGAGPLSITAVGLTPTSIVSPVVYSSSNPVSVVAWTAGSDSFTVTLSGDPGASCLISYIAIVAP